MGTFEIHIIDPKNRTIDDLYWFEARKPGTYPEKIGMQTLVAYKCDPSEGEQLYLFSTNESSKFVSSLPSLELCDGWPIGTYNVTAQLCNGECGSTHPHTSLYDTGKSSFEVTKKQKFI
jgi:hypothetical protein